MQLCAGALDATSNCSFCEQVVSGCDIFFYWTNRFQPKTKCGYRSTVNSEFDGGRFLVKATTNTRRGVAATMLSLLCAGLFALSLSGCVEAYYADTYYTPEYRYNTYYGPDYYPYYPYYSYYGGAYSYGY